MSKDSSYGITTHAAIRALERSSITPATLSEMLDGSYFANLPRRRNQNRRYILVYDVAQGAFLVVVAHPITMAVITVLTLDYYLQRNFPIADSRYRAARLAACAYLLKDEQKVEKATFDPIKVSRRRDTSPQKTVQQHLAPDIYPPQWPVTTYREGTYIGMKAMEQALDGADALSFWDGDWMLDLKVETPPVSTTAIRISKKLKNPLLGNQFLTANCEADSFESANKDETFAALSKLLFMSPEFAEWLHMRLMDYKKSLQYLTSIKLRRSAPNNEGEVIDVTEQVLASL